MSDFIPNSFQTPNTYVDEFMHLLTAEEYKVLSYASRRIFGFQKRTDRISLSQFAEGKEYDNDGARDYGTGLNKTTIRKALDGLIRFGLIEQVAENDPLKNEGAAYSLQLNSKKVDRAGLEARLQERTSVNLRRSNVQNMNTARSVRQNTPVLCDRTVNSPSVPQNAPVLPDRTPPFCETETQKTVETQKKTREIKNLPQPTVSEVSAKDSAPTDSAKSSKGAGKSKSSTRAEPDPRSKHPAIQLCRQTAGLYPPIALYDELIEALGTHPDFTLVQECWKAHCRAGRNKNSWMWVSDWYVNGIPDWYQKKDKANDSTNGKNRQQPVPNGMGPRTAIIANRNYGKWGNG